MSDSMANSIIGWSDIDQQPRHSYLGSGKKPNPKTFVSYDFGPKQKPVQITLNNKKNNTPEIEKNNTHHLWKIIYSMRNKRKKK